MQQQQNHYYNVTWYLTPERKALQAKGAIPDYCMTGIITRMEECLPDSIRAIDGT